MDKIQKIKTAKTITKAVVHHCVAGTIITAIHTLVPTETPAQKVKLYVGAWVVGGVVAERGDDYIEKTITELTDAFEELKNKNK